jgi:hypothetical protein
LKRTIIAAMALAATTAAFAVNEGSEPFNNDSSGAINFFVPDSLTGGLQNDGNPSIAIDYFTFSATGGVTYAFTTSGSVDPAVDIEDSTNILVQHNTAGHENFTWTAPSSGTFYVVVYGPPQPISGPYNVNVSVQSGINDWGLY